MNKTKLILKSIKHYKTSHLLVLIGVIISTAVLSGGLIIGDSVGYSLRKIVSQKLGNTEHVLQTQGRYFPAKLADRIRTTSDVLVAPILQLKAVASAESGVRLPNVQVVGYDARFQQIGNTQWNELNEDEVIVNSKVATDLQLVVGDQLLVKIEKNGFVSRNAPFVPDQENTVSLRLTVAQIIDAKSFGNFNLKTDQIVPHNVFLPIEELSGLMFPSTYANVLLFPESRFTADGLNWQIKNAWTLNDLNLALRDISALEQTELISDRIFIDDQVINTLNEAKLQPQNVFTYLINEVQNQNKSTPYSFVSAIEGNRALELEHNQIAINSWLAKDLNAKIGDTLSLKYFIVGSLRKMHEDSAKFVVKSVLEIKGFAADTLLMPAFEGLQGVEQCSDWEAGIPMDFSTIRDKDEHYWETYKGTPKAFVAYSTAKALWGSNLGNRTAIRFRTKTATKEQISETLLNKLTPSDVGMQITNMKQESLWSANNSVDFGQLFLALSFFLIVAAFILTALLFSMLLMQRQSEMGVLRSLGIKQRSIKQLYFTEGLLIAAIGSVIGTFIGVLLTQSVLYFLNSIWFDIVRTSAISIYVAPNTLLISALINFAISAAVIWFTIRKRMKLQIQALQRKVTHKNNANAKLFSLVTAFSGTIFIIAVFVFSNADKLFQNSGIFFGLGFLALATLLAKAYYAVICVLENRTTTVNPFTLAMRNLAFSRKRNLATVSILSIGVFIVVATGINRADFHSNAHLRSSGTGGFTYFTETNLPLNADLSSVDGLQKTGLSNIADSVGFVQFMSVSGDDASCLNLNRIIRPRIIGFEPEAFVSRKAFSFVKQIENQEDSPWNLLNVPLSENCIPAIADQTAIQWGLGKQVGDTLRYINEQGEPLNIVLVGGLASSIFQGSLIISEANLKANYPTVSGSSVMLVETNMNNKQVLKTELQMALRNYGIEVSDTAERLAMFNSVTNTYLDIFLALGGIALILGTFGVAIVLIRSISDQKNNFAMMQAFGIQKAKIQQIIYIEHAFVLATGVVIGLAAALLAGLPSLASVNTEVPIGLVATILSIFMLNGLFWITAGAKVSLKKKFINDLRNE